MGTVFIVIFFTLCITVIFALIYFALKITIRNPYSNLLQRIFRLLDNLKNILIKILLGLMIENYLQLAICSLINIYHVNLKSFDNYRCNLEIN